MNRLIDNKGKFDRKLKLLAKTHHNLYRVKKKHYKHFRTAFLRAIKEKLEKDNQWSNKIEKAWLWFWDKLTFSMTADIEGILTLFFFGCVNSQQHKRNVFYGFRFYVISETALSGSTSPVRRYRSPPKSYGCQFRRNPNFFAAASATFTASRVTSGPVPSPPITAMS